MKPYVICHMMSTIDGKIASGIEGVDILTDYFQTYTKVEDTYKPTAWICGRVTMQMFAVENATSLPKNEEFFSVEDYIAPHSGNLYMFAVDTKGVLRWKDNTITLGNVKETLHLVILVAKHTPKEYLDYLRSKKISYVFSGDAELMCDETFIKLKTYFGIEKLMLEGGGLLNGTVMAADCIDEISLIVTPLVVNRSSAPSVFERKAIEELTVKKYSLIEVKQLENDSVWLRYKKK